jgi:DNA repair exonuclease SbcCD nuclease subunit
MGYKKIYFLSDIHIPLLRNLDMYKSILTDVVKDISKRDIDISRSDKKIIIGGDLYHNKVNTSNEQNTVVAWFLKELNKICDVDIFCGNHDCLQNNSMRKCSISSITEIIDVESIRYLDRELGYKSGCIVDKNIVFCLFSIFDNYNRPIEIEDLKKLHPQKQFIGLIHAPILGSKTDLGYSIVHGQSTQIFWGLDTVLAGDIHLQQELIYKDIDKDVRIIYPSSVLQNSYGEKVTNHGYIIWNVETQTYEKVNIENDYGFYKFSIDNIEAIKNDEEKLGNL